MKKLNAVMAGLVLAGCGQSALAKDNLELNQALRERLDAVEQQWVANDAKAIVENTYVPETEITGEQTPGLYTGTQELTELVQTLVNDSKAVEITLDRVTPLGKNAAYSWVTWTVEPNEGEPFKMKSLFVWRNTPQGWRVVADMYATGEIPSK